MFTFPKSPADGDLFEAVDGVFFQFDKRNNCWVRVDGAEALGLATPTKDGLMSPEDFNKLEALLIPPPQSTIKGEDCNVAFTEGQIRLTSTDDSLQVAPSLKLSGKNVPWNLHKNTAGYDFKLNVQDLLDEMQRTGKLTKVVIQGQQGRKGEKGKDGQDRVETGPKGLTGPAGKHAPYNGTLSAEPNDFQLIDKQANRAIVDVQTLTDETGNYLLATRANIGNPDACPTEVIPKSFISPWVVVLSKQESALVRTLTSTNDCNNPCTICVSTLHYVNLELVLDAVFERFLELIELMRLAKQDLVIAWLQTMITVFNEQKQALCCALENCKTAQRNASERRILESQRIQAAQADLSLVIDGQNDREVLDMDADKECTNDAVDPIIKRGVGCECLLEYVLDAKLHATDPSSQFKGRFPATVNTVVNNVYQTQRTGVLELHSEVMKPSFFQTDPAFATRSTETVNIIEVTSSAIPPEQLIYADTWVLNLRDFAAVVTPGRAGAGHIVLSAAIVQGGNIVGTGSLTLDLADLSSTTKIIPIAMTGLTIGAPVTLELAFSVDTFFTKNETAGLVSIDYVLGEVHLNGTGAQASIDMAIQSDWNEPNWTVDGQRPFSQNGYLQLSLPPGTYVAQIVDCCADMDGRNTWKGTVALEFNKTKEVTGADGSLTTDPLFTERETVFFPDMGTFNDNASARLAYLGQTVEFTHLGGQIRSWVVDPSVDPSDNAGQISVCIRAIECLEGGTGTGAAEVTGDVGAIYVYRFSINPLNLVGVIKPFTGDLDAITNYGFNEGSVDGENVKYGPVNGSMTGVRVLNESKSFFYHGPDGLSFYTVHGGTGTDKTNRISMGWGVVANSVPTEVKVSDDPGEVVQVQPDTYSAVWETGTYGSDGFVIGPLDLPSDGAGWNIGVRPDDMGSLQVWNVYSADGNVFTLYFDPTGLGNTFTNEEIVFSPIKSGCVMSYKEIQWLERGHRIGASCSCVVNIDGQDYIVVKRSLGTDITCGGGESLSNPCIAQYVTLGVGHPAIAWPTFNGEEFLGIPTSGGHGFTFDQTFSEKALAKIAAGEFTKVHGDPATNITFVLLPTAV